MNNGVVGEYIILPRSLRSQNEPPSATKKRGLQKPSPLEKVDRPSLYAKVETDEVS